MKQKKSKFQTRLDEIVAQRKKEETQATEEVTAPKVRLHNRETPTREPGFPPRQTAQDVPGDWISMENEKPPYYYPIDIYDGTDIMDDWNRVSTGERDYYCNNRTNDIVWDITYWRKRPGVKYNPYQPMTEDDIKEFTRRDINEIVKNLTSLVNRRIHSNLPHIEYVAGVDDAIITVEAILNPRRMTEDKKDNQ